MKKQVLISGALIVAAVVALFLMPREVVENDESQNVNASVTQNPAGKNGENISAHKDAGLNDSQKQKLSYFKQQLEKDENREKSVNFADSLYGLYYSVQAYDSAAYYKGLIANRLNTLESNIAAGEAYYEAFSFAMDPEKQQELGQTAKSYFDKVLEENPDYIDAEVKNALIAINGSNPMQGVLSLRGLLEKDPKNETINYQLGLMSMQTQQWHKAEERFRTLVGIAPENTEYNFYLGVSLFEDGHKQEAKEYFEKVLKLEDNPEVVSAVNGYLKEIQ
ncbi:tetratricopeptide repeat protein [Marinigracilibium pacificum]|uniref:Tetratricopeptide repeat protein n=1 Tax=Marinigracilibium pacificum TaxID=2729599 RepID=A0A848IYL1_9BACT|nr:tetratricopeptide repeat protein [Marinigracilibium pacificum]NMM47079.1 tetratricopeptide repeat protein [Marinigracilibium pacificum]